ncbi:MAG: hypothetical protein R3F61_05745 [Myxococcota bacterium]
MTPLTLQLAFTPWTLATSDDSVTVTARETCIDGECSATGDPSVDFGVWTIGDLQIRWTANDHALVRVGSGRWRPARLTAATPADRPPDTLEVAPIDARGWAPGLWREVTVGCDRARPAWVFDSIVRNGTSLVAVPDGSAWRLQPGTNVHRCHDADGAYAGIRDTVGVQLR